MNTPYGLMRRLAILGAVAAAAVTVRGGQTRAAESRPNPPNIVFIMADDLGWGELGCYGQTKIRTPHIDGLAREGMRFTQHYSGSPVCAPSRCVLMTGLHTGRAEIRNNKSQTDADGQRIEGQHPLSADAQTIAEVLKKAGYATGAFGKWGLGPADSTGAPHRQGFDLFFGYICQSMAHSYYPPHLWRNDERIPFNANPVPGHAEQPEGPVRYEDWTAENYAPAAMLAEAVKFIHANKDRPFFLYLPFIEPHVALQPPRALVETYPDAWDDRPYRGQCGYTPHPRPRAAYAALITSLDNHVGTILRTLEELDLADNTLVVFTSDNGPTHDRPADEVFGVGGVDTAFFNSTAGLRGRKGSVYGGGIRVPLIVRWPGRVEPGSVSGFPSYFPDHFPTLCEAAGVPVPENLSGLSLLPTITGHGGQPAHEAMVWAFLGYRGQVAVRLGDLKVLRQGLAQKGDPGPWEVYDLARDPNETTDLAAERPEVIARAEEVLRHELTPNPVFPLAIPGVNR